MRFTGFAVLLLLAVASEVHAADAEELVSKGIALRKERHDAEALALFREAYAMQAAPRTRAQIGLAELALGKFLEAEADLQGAMAAATDPWIAKNTDALRAALTTVEDHLAWVTVTTTKGAEVRIDGRLIGTAPLDGPVRVIAGTVRVEVSRPSELPARRELDAAPRQKVAITIEALPPKPAAAPVTVDPAPMTAQVPTTKYLGVGFIGFGVASLGAGTYFAIRALQQYQLRKDHCGFDPNGNYTCDSDGLIADRRTRDAGALATIGFVAGAVSTVAGIYLVRTSHVTVSAVTTGRSGRLFLTGEF
jgi:hypothetical protein